MKQALRDLAPPALLRIWRRWRLPVRYRGTFQSWEQAVGASEGYSASAILDRAVSAASDVGAGRAAYERDGVAFPEPTYSWPLLACLLRVAAKREGQLDVVDFGGSLGSTYFQHRAFWHGPLRVRWRVVEQPAWAEAGAARFAGGGLSFHTTLDEAWDAATPQVLLLSSVLQYLPKPHAFLDEALARGPAFVLLDRTAIADSGGGDQLTVQQMRAPLCPSSYPCWFFNQPGLQRHFASAYRSRADWLNDEYINRSGRYRGFWFERTTP